MSAPKGAGDGITVTLYPVRRRREKERIPVRESAPSDAAHATPAGLLVVSDCQYVSLRRPSRSEGAAYLMTSVTTPEPTVRPPSRIANRRPWSMAIGWISSISIWTLSPGMTISTPSGSLATPVTSVVRK